MLLYLTAFLGEEADSAKGTNLLFFLPTAVISVVGHIKNGYIKWKIALFSAVFGIPFVFLGFYIAQSIDKTLLRLIFGGFLLVIGWRAIKGK